MKGSTFLVEVSIADLPFPITVPSGTAHEGQATVATLSVKARIMAEMEADWTDRFIRVTHQKRDALGHERLEETLLAYKDALEAKSVELRLDYPYFVEKRAPVSGEACLVRYDCRLTGRYPSLDEGPRVRFRVICPVLSSTAVAGEFGGLPLALPQPSRVAIEIESDDALSPESIAAIVDEAGLVPVYSYLSKEDRRQLTERTRTLYRPSVEVVDRIRAAMAARADVSWYSIEMIDRSPLQTYTAIQSTHKSLWVPGSYLEHGDA